MSALAKRDGESTGPRHRSIFLVSMRAEADVRA